LENPDRPVVVTGANPVEVVSEHSLTQLEEILMVSGEF
jgi:hypothetical protein